MTFIEVKMRLSRYKKMSIFAKSIELITLTALTILKDLYLEIKNSSAILNSLLSISSIKYVKNSVILPYFTDKNCSGIMNNRLINGLDKIIEFLNYKNILSSVHGTGMTYQKKWNKMKSVSEGSYVASIGNIYNLSNETFTYYKSYLLYRYILLLDSNTCLLYTSPSPRDA